MFRKQRAAEGRESWIELQRWYREALGKVYAEAEAGILNDILPLLFGYHIVALGVPSPQDLLATSPIAHHCHVDYVHYRQGSVLDLLAEPAQLPIASDSIDVVVVPHVLEFVLQPHAVLREVDRILIPEGHLVILGFNPFSLWGLWRLLHYRGGKTPWDAGLLSVARIRDWLALLGIETLFVRYSFYRPPLKHAELLGKLCFLERLGARWWPCGGGGYVLVAKKRVSTLTPIKPRWRTRRRLLAEGMLNNTLRRHHRD